jgi:hypothetical protein
MRVLEGRFVVWGAERQLDLDTAWLTRDAGVSWAYPVHYFDYLPALADRGREEATVAAAVCALMRRWILSHPAGTEVAWDPYPTALRIVNWLDVVHTLGERATPEWRSEVLASVYVQASWLRRRLERHLLGTHLLKNAKALLIAGATYTNAAAESWRREAEALLVRELEAQIHAEGSHIEPSIMYHCMALEDVLDLLNFHGAASARLRESLTAAARKMLHYATCVLTPSGGYPLLGDAWDGGAQTPRALAGYAQRLGLDARVASSSPQARPQHESTAARKRAGDRVEAVGEGTLSLFSDAGIVVWRDARCYLLADVDGVGVHRRLRHVDVRAGGGETRLPFDLGAQHVAAGRARAARDLGRVPGRSSIARDRRDASARRRRSGARALVRQASADSPPLRVRGRADPHRGPRRGEGEASHREPVAPAPRLRGGDRRRDSSSASRPRAC